MRREEGTDGGRKEGREGGGRERGRREGGMGAREGKEGMGGIGEGGGGEIMRLSSIQPSVSVIGSLITPCKPASSL